MEPALYVEISPLLSPVLTGIARFSGRLVAALSGETSLRLFTTLSAREVGRLALRHGLVAGEEIVVPRGGLHGTDHDLDVWTRDLFRFPHAPRERSAEPEGNCLYLQLRPEERHFAREVSVLYDFTPLLLPGTHRADTRDMFGRFFSTAIAHSDKAVAISESTRADAAWLCPLPPDDVTVAYPGPSLCAATHVSTAAVPRGTRLALIVSTREPRKNASFLAEWFLSTDVLDDETELWWVGPRGWLWRTPREARRRRHRGRQVKFVGMVSDRELCELYRRATFTIYPSLYEGFGFPVLDSLLHGAPVLCSFHSSLKEFAGAGVYYFDPYDPNSLDAACRQLFASPRAPIERPDLRGRCSWESLAHTVLDLCAPVSR